MTAMRTMGLAPVLPPDATLDILPCEYVVRLALPGFAREELEVEVEGRFVTVRGDQLETETDDGPFRLHERIEERFEFPADVVPHGITAGYTHGRLELRAPRTSGASHATRKVPIGPRTAVNPDASGV